jgi:hypothetical protein
MRRNYTGRRSSGRRKARFEEAQPIIVDYKLPRRVEVGSQRGQICCAIRLIEKLMKLVIDPLTPTPSFHFEDRQAAV